MLCGKGRNRTQNLGIPSPALCQLRYEPGAANCWRCGTRTTTTPPTRLSPLAQCHGAGRVRGRPGAVSCHLYPQERSRPIAGPGGEREGSVSRTRMRWPSLAGQSMSRAGRRPGVPPVAGSEPPPVRATWCCHPGGGPSNPIAGGVPSHHTPAVAGSVLSTTVRAGGRATRSPARRRHPVVSRPVIGPNLPTVLRAGGRATRSPESSSCQPLARGRA
jgi:hypothetical protein